jgi:tRNA wybutosine-synthesizing protein 4
MIKKRDTVNSTKELNSLLTNMEVLEGDILLRSDQYLQLGCDLRDLKVLNQTLASAVDFENCLVLLTAEVSITYMNVEAADALIEWAGTLPEGKESTTEKVASALTVQLASVSWNSFFLTE